MKEQDVNVEKCLEVAHKVIKMFGEESINSFEYMIILSALKEAREQEGIVKLLEKAGILVEGSVVKNLKEHLDKQE